MTTDHLGSPRVITDENGAVIDRKDYTAFSEESYTPERTVNLGYSTADEIRKGYTGYEKDLESGLDFAQARYYKAAHGRYTSVDPLTASASIRNPQTFNRYSYVLNSPYKFTDPLGLLPLSMACGNSCPGSFMGTGGGALSSTQDYDSGTRNGADLQAAAALAAESTPTDAGVATATHEAAHSQSEYLQAPVAQQAEDPSTVMLGDAVYEANNGLDYTIIPIILPPNVPALAHELSEARYSAVFTMTIVERETGEIRQNYSYQIDQQEKRTTENGVIELGPYFVDKRTVNPAEKHAGYNLIKNLDKTWTGTITIYAPCGEQVGTTSFKATVTGDAGDYRLRIVETARTAGGVTWTNP